MRTQLTVIERLQSLAPFAGIAGLIRGGPPLFVTEIRDAQGNPTYLTRQDNGRLKTVGSARRHLDYRYGNNGFVSEVTDTAGRRLQFTYNATNRLETVTDADGNVSRMTYVDDSEMPPSPVCGAQATMGERIKTLTYPGKSAATENDYGVGKRVLRQTAADGRETRFSYQLTGACVTHVNTPDIRCTGPTCPNQDNWANHAAGWRVHGGQVIATTVTQSRIIATSFIKPSVMRPKKTIFLTIVSPSSPPSKKANCQPAQAGTDLVTFLTLCFERP